MFTGISRNGLILGAFTLATTLLITLTFWLTKPVIEQQQQQKLLQTLSEVMPASQWDNDLANNCALVSEPLLGVGAHKVYRAWLGDEPSGLILESTTPQGYSGNIKYLVSILDNHTIGGVRVLAHKETPGLGDKIELRISDWILTFSGKSILDTEGTNWAVKKDGGRFDQFTGATITPRAIIKGVKDTTLWASENYEEIFAAPNDCADTSLTVADFTSKTALNNPEPSSNE